MNKTDLVDLMEQIAERDLVDGHDLYDHPCSVAVRAIEQCFDDIDHLRKIGNDKTNKKSKKSVVLLSMNYDPEW